MTVVTGFLGSGKTTLISRLLHDPRLANTAVIVNEFGEVGLDHALVEAVRGDVVLLAQGCLCCSLNGDLAATLEGLDNKRAVGAVPNFDRVIVETTGLADPAPVLQTILDRPALLCGYRLHHVLTTVDAATGEQTLERHCEAVRQTAVADRLLMTKTDLVDECHSRALRRHLSLLNPRAPIWLVRHGDIDPDTLFADGEPAAWFRWKADHGYASRNSPSAGHARRMTTMALEFPGPVSYAAFTGWLGGLVSAHGGQLLRVKGIIAIHGQDRPIVVHGVQHLFHPPRQLATWPAGLARSTLVFILDGLDPSVVIESAVAAGLTPVDEVRHGH